MVCGRVDAVGWTAAPLAASIALVPHGHAASASFHDSQAEQADAARHLRRGRHAAGRRRGGAASASSTGRPSRTPLRSRSPVTRCGASCRPAAGLHRTRRPRGPGRADDLGKGLRTSITVRQVHLPNRHMVSHPAYLPVRAQVVIAPRPALLP